MSSLAQFYRTILRITKQPKPTVFRSTVHASFALTHSIQIHCPCLICPKSIGQGQADLIVLSSKPTLPKFYRPSLFEYSCMFTHAQPSSLVHIQPSQLLKRKVRCQVRKTLLTFVIFLKHIFSVISKGLFVLTQISFFLSHIVGIQQFNKCSSL